MKTPEKIRHTPRLFIQEDLIASQPVNILDQKVHYLSHVLRMKEGDALRLFNGRDGEFLAHVHSVSKKTIQLVPEIQIRQQTDRNNISLCAAPIKKAHFDYMMEKATELGVNVIQPILTERTQIREVNVERMRSIVIEAAEQSERLDIPEVHKPITLTEMLGHLPKDHLLIVCAELGEASEVRKAFTSQTAKTAREYAILVGPEGGFGAEEFNALRKVSKSIFIRLGPRILRADTAALAALTLWQALAGDWATEE